MKPFIPLDIPEDLLDIVGDLIVYEKEKNKDVEFIEEELERAYAELDIEPDDPKEERKYKIVISL